MDSGPGTLKVEPKTPEIYRTNKTQDAEQRNLWKLEPKQYLSDGFEWSTIIMYCKIVVVDLKNYIFFFYSKLSLLLRLLEKHKALRLSFSPSSSSLYLFRNSGEFGAKKHFADHQTPNTMQLFVTKVLFIFWKSRSERGFPRVYLINVVTCLLYKNLSKVTWRYQKK